jgi:NAD(P)-dependent dehydrogenase (short-subunit alcohol dehydrogenase family)
VGGDVVRDVIDEVLEFSVVGSFSRIGYLARRRLYHWSTDAERLDGQVVVVTGATSGLGREAATSFAHAGARVVMVARDVERGARVRSEIVALTGNEAVEVIIADLGDLDSTRAGAAELQKYGAINVLVHNAGSLQRTRQINAQGLELTAVVHLLAPFLLTRLLMRELEAGGARVIWVSSGGMYSQPLDVDALEMGEQGYDGVKAYARVKRAQVSLVAWWAPELLNRGITMVAMHPGWADTPGVRTSLPTFRRLMGPLLRSSAQGADSIIWLATCDERLAPGGLWLDRRPRPVHRMAKTRVSDSQRERERLWNYCLSRTQPDVHLHDGDV